jgi:hypothetical protein
VPAAQNHVKSNYMRNLPSSEVFNEEVCNLIKRKIVSNAYTLDPLTLTMEYDGSITSQDTESILERVTKLYGRVVEATDVAHTPERREALASFAQNLSKAYYGFESDFFHQNVARIVDDVISVFRGALDLWPTLVEVVYFQKQRMELPMKRVRNRSYDS